MAFEKSTPLIVVPLAVPPVVASAGLDEVLLEHLEGVESRLLHGEAEEGDEGALQLLAAEAPRGARGIAIRDDHDGS